MRGGAIGYLAMAVVCFMASALSGAEPARIEIVELPAGDVKGLLVIPWIADGDVSWRTSLSRSTAGSRRSCPCAPDRGRCSSP